MSDGVGIEAVAFIDAMGDVVIDVSAGGFEQVPEHGGAGDAVDVVVAVEGDFFVGADALDDAIGGAVHVGEEIRRMKVFELGVEEGGSGGGSGEAAGDEDAGDECGKLEGVGYCLGLGFQRGVEAGKDPFLFAEGRKRSVWGADHP